MKFFLAILIVTGNYFCIKAKVLHHPNHTLYHHKNSKSGNFETCVSKFYGITLPRNELSCQLFLGGGIGTR